MALVGDRGMITSARITEELAPAGLDWISCLRAPQIAALASDTGPLQLSLFDERDLAEITSPDFPGERLWLAAIRRWPRSGQGSARSLCRQRNVG